MSGTNADISIIIINWNTKQLLLDCLASVYATVRLATFEVFIVDNGSTDGSVEVVAKNYPAVMVIANQKNEGFAKGNNAAIGRITGAYAVLLNSDTLLKESALDRMFAFMETNPRAGMCGPQLLYGDGSLQISTGTFPDLLSELTSSSLVRLVSRRRTSEQPSASTGPHQVDFIIGACMFVRSSAIDAVGSLDDDFFFYYEEIDWCHRMHKAGWEIYFLPNIEIVHFGGQSTKNINLRARVESWRSRYLYFRKSLGLRGIGTAYPVVLGFAQTTVRFAEYTIMNLLTLVLLPRLRRRWLMFAYLLAWHLRGMPVSMGLPR